MRRIASLLLALAAGCFLPPDARAGDGGGVIHRCQRDDGVLLFTDRPCARFGARDRLPPVGYDGDAVRRRPGMPAPMPVGAVCADSPESLRRYARVAIDGRDPNALAGLVDWRGMSRGPAMQHLAEIRRLVRRPLEEVVFDGGGYDGSLLSMSTRTDSVRHGGDLMTVAQRGPGGALSTRSFGVRKNLGCYWLSLVPAEPALRLAGD